MNDLVSSRDLRKAERAITGLPADAEENIFKALNKNAQEARGYMQALVPTDTGKTQAETVATAYARTGATGFAMRTERRNDPGADGDKTERIRAILFANETDFFYAVWNLNKKRWKSRMNRALKKSAREAARKL